MKKLPKIIVILGPTASGKSSWGLRLAKKVSGYIISADSRQIYREMDIGTNKTQKSKPESSECSRTIKNQKCKLKFKSSYYGEVNTIPHYMIDVINPNDDYNVAQYQAKVKRIIKSRQPQIPFLVGGTGLYIQAIVDNLIIPEVPPNAKIRTKIEAQTTEQLFNQLKKLDLACAKKIDSKNRRRLIRAVEVCLATGQPFSRLRQKGKQLFDALQIGINISKKELNQRIDQRVDKMIKIGLVDEVKHLLKKYQLTAARHPEGTTPSGGATEESRGHPYLDTANAQDSSVSAKSPRPQNNNHARPSARNNLLPAFSGIGYREIIQYLQNKISLEQAIKLIKQHTRQYAKRQMTWFKRDSRIHWVTKYSKAEKLIKKFLGK